ncbi:acetylxylan esterase [Streptomyces sparsogenes]|uniref:Acetyl xylan esterase n=1 Tax=Streptomyces sparsogenes DSM 40356 TaxID=1331668 RepID=A0A1R1SA13_9ACTN|nr:alpha/beta fold hydrolase [Streptomyces sparsogenes]OMI35042.1 acetyl xylan esterase [Streptomyces sparsogenes DSM 40356]
MFVDLPLDQLRGYRPPLPEPDGFDAFWERTLAEADEHALDAVFTGTDSGLTRLHTYDVEFSGFGGHRIRGWLLAPRDAAGPLPCVVQYIGYNGGRGLPHNWLLWPSVGYAVFVMDSRGQGWSANNPGDTPDPVGGTGPEAPGKMTQGVLSPDDYYYRRLYTDAVRAVAAARAHPLVDRARIAVSGGSQGGGLALAAAGLVPDVAAALVDVPFMTHIRRALEITDADPYGELARFCAGRRDLADQVLATLDHFDGLNFAARASAPALFSTALRDPITPTSCGFAAYHHYAGEKDLRVWAFNGHEGGGVHQQAEQIAFLRGLFG